MTKNGILMNKLCIPKLSVYSTCRPTWNEATTQERHDVKLNLFDTNFSNMKTQGQLINKEVFIRHFGPNI